MVFDNVPPACGLKCWRLSGVRILLKFGQSSFVDKLKKRNPVKFVWTCSTRDDLKIFWLLC